jgi:4-hydroxy-tetrahydrodipicolinate synthase
VSVFEGVLTALVTPFRDGAIDEPALRNLVELQIEAGVDGLVPCGSTGESATLSHAAHRRVIEISVAAARGRVPVIAGTGSNSTAEAIELTAYAKQAGASAALVVLPYYNKPTQEGQYQHYKAIHDAVDIPIVIYNVPGRTAVDMTVETMARLAKLPRIVGVKDATADLTRPMLLRLAAGPDFCQLSGEDATIVPFLSQGGHGCISVTSNVAPRLCAELHDAWAKRDLDTVMTINERLTPLHKALFVETSPGPVKYAAELLGRASAATRLPLCEIAAASKERVKAAMVHAGLLN